MSKKENKKVDKKNEKDIDKVTGVETTGHEWDGLKELNNPAPMWWLWVFLVTVIWSIGYWVVYPAWPTIKGHTEGILGWTQYEKLENEQEEIVARKFDNLASLKSKSLQDIRQDAVLYEFAMKGGASAFKDNCATCHGIGAEGTLAYPNLNDDDWLWGGSLEDIYQTITHGIRSKTDDITRDSLMPAFGRDGILGKDEISAVAEYVLTLSKEEGNFQQNAEWQTGQQIFLDNCSACHGESGQGIRDFGAPRLNDEIWLRGNQKSDIISMIYNAKMGMMPNWQGRLDEETIKMLTIYVHSLGGGE
jgi:cytochrome c oxidase cbb3-type subunit 3